MSIYLFGLAQSNVKESAKFLPLTASSLPENTVHNTYKCNSRFILRVSFKFPGKPSSDSFGVQTITVRCLRLSHVCVFRLGAIAASFL